MISKIKNPISYFFVVMLLLLQSCGKPTVSFEEKQFEPNLAIEGYLIPGNKVDKIYVWKNFPAFKNVENLAIPHAVVQITDIEEEKIHRLYYNKKFVYFEYLGYDLDIKSGNTYRLDVSAKIGEKTYQSTSSTTVPNKGLKITAISDDSLSYRQRDTNGNLKHFKVDFERSPGMDLYLVTLTALDASTETFIYDNPFSDVDEQDVGDDLLAWQFNYEWLQDLPKTPGSTSFEIYWYLTSFYGKYELIIYAVDKNWGDFLQTYNDVQEPDGNFHEPVFRFAGDGVGVFGSAVTDTINFTIVP
jgi:hypothetical protein